MTSLLVDVGATSIKWTFANPTFERTRRRSTPRPLYPTTLVAFIAHRARSRNCLSLGVAFPGEVRAGTVIDAANLTRPMGPGTERSADLATAWTKYDLEQALHHELSIPVVVVNDAYAVARSSDEMHGRHLFVVLGTGCGVGLVDAGEVVAIRDFGDDLFRGRTLDEAVGERARDTNEQQWKQSLEGVIDYLAGELSVDMVHVAGGNARRLHPHDLTTSVPVVIDRNVSALRGVFRCLAESS